MKRIQQSALMAGLIALMLGGCSSTGTTASADNAAARSGEAAQDITYDLEHGGSAPAGTSGASMGSSGASMSGSGTSAAATPNPSDQSAYSSSAPAASQTPNSTVTSIEAVPRQSGAVGTGSMAGAAVGGTSGNPEDRVYRITVQMDDGSSKTITQETAPTFKSGDRVRVENGMVQR